jgi:hypothetical protein
VFTILLFCGFFGDFLVRYFRAGAWRYEVSFSGSGNETRKQPDGTRLMLFFGFMVLAVVLILARCAYRLAELNEGYDGELVGDEALFIALEGV